MSVVFKKINKKYNPKEDDYIVKMKSSNKEEMLIIPKTESLETMYTVINVIKGIMGPNIKELEEEKEKFSQLALNDEILIKVNDMNLLAENTILKGKDFKEDIDSYIKCIYREDNKNIIIFKDFLLNNIMASYEYCYHSVSLKDINIEIIVKNQLPLSIKCL